MNLLYILLVATPIFAEEQVCIRKVVERREVCNEEKHPVAGSALGGWSLGLLEQ